MTIVYRFENSDGAGPWTGDASYIYDDAAQPTMGEGHSCDAMPSLHSHEEQGRPAHDHYMRRGVDGYHFGFTSKDQLRRAFPSSVGRAAMGKYGQILKVYDVPPAALLRGAAQCIFKKDQATLLATLDIKTLKEIS